MKQVISGSTLRTPTLRARTTRPAPPSLPGRCRVPGQRLDHQGPGLDPPGQVLGGRAELRMVVQGTPGLGVSDPEVGQGQHPAEVLSHRSESKASATTRPANRTGIPAASQAASRSSACGVSATSRSRRSRTAAARAGRAARTQPASAGQPSQIHQPGPLASRDAARQMPRPPLHPAPNAAPGWSAIPAREPGPLATGARSDSSHPPGASRPAAAVPARAPPAPRTRRTPSRRGQPTEHRPSTTPSQLPGPQPAGPAPRSTARRDRPAPPRRADSPSPAVRRAASRWVPAQQVSQTHPAAGQHRHHLAGRPRADSSPATTARRLCSAASAAATCSKDRRHRRPGRLETCQARARSSRPA